MPLKFALTQNRTDSSIKAVFVSNKATKKQSADFEKISEVECAGGGAETLASLVKMPGPQGESFQRILEDLVLKAYMRGREDANHSLATQIRWPPGHD